MTNEQDDGPDVESLRPLDPPKPGRCPQCGGVFKQRSTKDHKMYWAILRSALKQWPAEHRAKPFSVENLHGWLLIEVGHKECVDSETMDVDKEMETARRYNGLVGRRIHCMRAFPIPGGLRICVPGPFAYDKSGKREYETVRRAVYEVIENVLGVSVEQLKRERGHADD